MNDKEILLRSSYDFEFFCTEVLGLVIAEHHRKIVSLLKDETKNIVIIEVARGHGKTELMKAYVIWYATFNEKKRICIISSAKEQSWDILLDIKNKIEENPILSFLRPKVIKNQKEKKWSASHIILSTGSSIKSLPFNSTARGQHVHLLICDDILRDVNSGTMPEEKQKKLFADVITPIVRTLKGKLAIIGTPQTTTDIIAVSKDVLSKLGRSSSFISLPAVIRDKNGKWLRPLWPKDEKTGLGFTLNELRQQREYQNALSPFSFEKEYLLEPFAGEQSIFKPQIIKRQVLSNIDTTRRGPCLYYVGVDVAMSTSSKADYTVITIIEVDEENIIRVKNIIREKGLGFIDTLIKLQELDKYWKFNGILIEQVGLSYGLIESAKNDKFFTNPQTGQAVKNLIGGIVEGFKTSGENKPRLISQLQSAFESGYLFIPDNEILLNELFSFRAVMKNGRVKLEGVGQHDDMVMSLALALEAYNSLGTYVTASYI